MRFRWNPFEFDLRSLAVFRTGLGLVMLYDLMDRARDISLFYTDAGAMPRVTAIQNFSTSIKFSFHLMSGSAFFEGCLFLIHGLIVLAFLFNYRTTLANIACWILFISLQCRNFLVHQASDTFLCQLLFLGIFLPLERASFDNREERVTTPGTVAYCLFLPSVLIAAGLFKAYSPLWQRGAGTFHAFVNDFHGAAWGVELLNYPSVINFLNDATVAMEIIFPAMLFVADGALRLVILPPLFIFFASLGLCLRLGEFAPLLIISVVPYLPSQFWSWLPLPDRPACEPRLPISRMGLRYLLPLPLVSFILLFEAQSLNYPVRLPPQLIDVGNAFHILETWSMFSVPAYNDGWYLVLGEKHDGNQVNLLTGEEGEHLDRSRPKVPGELYKNQRWLKFFQHMIYYRYLAPNLVKELCDESDGRLKSIQLLFHRKHVSWKQTPTYDPEEVLYQGQCS